ncbi:MAG TPA: AAA family ATPase, partial [Euzebya sp.]|nr:AAA family ATPase [Euzebya sp.]
QLAGVRFATTRDRQEAVHRIVHAAEQQSVRLTPPELATVPAELRRADGTSVLRPRHSEVFTSADLLAAEDRLLNLGRTTTAPALPAHTVGQATVTGGLGDDQAAAVTAVATSGRIVDVLIGPAGTGKTTAMRALRHAWTNLYGDSAVIGLTPSAAAAQVLGEDLGVQADTLAKWLHEHHAGRTALSAGQLVIIDEASLAGSRSLHAIADHAATVGAKVLMVGDWAQLASVNAGGALQLLARDRDDVAELTGVRRFQQPWEAAATLQLRDGNPVVLDTYAQHGRLHDGEGEAMLDAAYTAWQADMAAGRQSLLIAPTREQVALLNRRAQADRIDTGHVEPDAMVPLHDSTAAGVGDVIVTRRNDRLLHGPGGWVRNGDRWSITATHPDGSVTVARHGQHGTIRLPVDYVAAHVELGYATTAHRAQGATVDTAHTIVTAATTRETLYVALTRGRRANHAYTCTDTPDTEPHNDAEALGARQVLTGVLGRTGSEPSAHARIATEQDRYGGIAQLAAEYETIAAAAQYSRWARLIRASGLTDDQAEQVITSEAFGPLCAVLRGAEAHNVDPDLLLPRLMGAGSLDGVADVAAVLHHRLDVVMSRYTQDALLPEPRLIGGLIPHAAGPMTEDMRTALDEREQLIQQRAVDLARGALTNGEAWTRHLGPPPIHPERRRVWSRALVTIAAYRNRHAITGDTPLGDRLGEQRPGAAAAVAALRRAQHAAASEQRRVDAVGHHRRRPPEREGPSIR